MPFRYSLILQNFALVLHLPVRRRLRTKAPPIPQPHIPSMGTVRRRMRSKGPPPKPVAPQPQVQGGDSAPPSPAGGNPGPPAAGGRGGDSDNPDDATPI